MAAAVRTVDDVGLFYLSIYSSISCPRQSIDGCSLESVVLALWTVVSQGRHFICAASNENKGSGEVSPAITKRGFVQKQGFWTTCTSACNNMSEWHDATNTLVEGPKRKAVSARAFSEVIVLCIRHFVYLAFFKVIVWFDIAANG